MKNIILLIISVSACFAATCFGATCSEKNPAGPRAVIDCLANANGMTPSDFWNKKLFDSSAQDKYCSDSLSGIPAVQKAQREMFTIGCAKQKGTYFSYENFVAADETLKQKLSDTYQFMRQGTYEVKLQELANMLATAALETTGAQWPNPYKTDGFYYRYENGPLQSADPVHQNPALGSCYGYPANPEWVANAVRSKGTNCRNLGLSEFYTEYYPFSTFAVAIKDVSNSKVNTSLVMYDDQKYDTATNTITKAGIPTLYAGGTYAPPTGYTWQYMNAVIQPGYWVGMGNLQLTGDSMAKFFGWYYQKLASPSQTEADYQAFVQQFLSDGQLAWIGGLWFWNYRIAGQGFSTLHNVIANTQKAACHDIGITTYMLNGGCNDSAERVKYYNYFKTEVFKQYSEAEKATYNGATVNSYICSQALYEYCTH